MALANKSRRSPPREAEIIRLRAQGLTVKEVAARIGKSTQLVKKLSLKAYRRNAVRSLVELLHVEGEAAARIYELEEVAKRPPIGK